MKRIEMDNIDRQILNMLLQDANAAYVDIAKAIHVSPGTIHVRVKRLRDHGLIKNAFMNVDYAKLGYDVCAFLGIHLEKTSFFIPVIEQLQRIPEVVNAHFTTGQYSIFAKLICRDMEHLRQVLHDRIQEIPGIRHIESFLSLDETIHRSIQLPEEE